jgi:TonB family protein
VVEHYLDTVGVTGSNPVSRTIFFGMNNYFVRSLSLGMLIIASASPGFGQREAVVPNGPHEPTNQQVRALAIYSPRPEYPFEARVRGITGRGVAVLDVDKDSGHVTSARMALSTGNAILDNCSLDAFRRWRFKPGTVAKVKIPIAFTMTGGRFVAGAPIYRTEPLPIDHPVKVHAVSGKGYAIAIYASAPQYPATAYAHHLAGKGVAIITVDADTGAVVSARMQPGTGHAELDTAALKAFRQWRFRRGTGGDFKIPVTYKL